MLGAELVSVPSLSASNAATLSSLQPFPPQSYNCSDWIREKAYLFGGKAIAHPLPETGNHFQGAADPPIASQNPCCSFIPEVLGDF